MEKGAGYEFNTTEHLLKEEQGSNKKGTGNKSDPVENKLKASLRKQQSDPQGHAKKVKSDESLLANWEDDLEKKIKTPRSFSQGYAAGTEFSDEESAMVEIDLN